MIDDFIIKIENSEKFFRYYIDETPKLNMVEVSDETFNYVDIDENDIIKFIESEYYKNKYSWKIKSKADRDITTKIRQACAEVAHKSHVAWPNNIIVNPKYKELIESCNDLFKIYEDPWTVTYDNNVQGVMVVLKRKLASNVWTPTLFYKNNENNKRIYVDPRSSYLYKTIYSYSFVEVE